MRYSLSLPITFLIGSMFVAIYALTPQIGNAAVPPVILWTEDPWIDTQGGTKVPTSAEVAASSWTMPMLRNDVEQMMIGVMNTSASPIDVRVTLTAPSTFRYGKAELHVAGAIKSRAASTTPNEAALVNLFTPAHVASFNSRFPETFVGEEVWKDFPVLHLKPNEPVRLWLRVKTYAGDVPGTSQTASGMYAFGLNVAPVTGGEALNKSINVEVLSQYVPTKPYKEVLTYGGYNETVDQVNHTTVNGTTSNHVQKKGYNYKNLLSYSRSGLWSKDLVLTTELAKTNPAEFRTKIRAAVDAYYARLRSEGWTDDQILMSIYDEPFLEHVEGIGLIAAEVKAYRPEARIVENPAGNRLLETLKGLAPYVDIWVPHESMYRLKEQTDFLKSTGKPLWFYNNWYGEGARNEVSLLRYFRRTGWTSLEHNLAGMGMWGVNFGYGDIWNDFDGDARGSANLNDAVLVFPSSAGPISTRGMEAWRESVEDVSMYERIRQARTQGKYTGTWKTRADAWIAETPAGATKSFKTDPAYVIGARKEAWELLRIAWPAASSTPSSPCTLTHPSGSTPQSGFGASWNHFTSAKELLLSATCSEANLDVVAGNTDSSTYIYKLGYRWVNGAWQAFTFSGSTPTGDWFQKSASASIPKLSGTTTYFVGYTCQRINGAWKCGCSDASCATPKWQLQGVE
jgi:hypothetical protein